MEDVDDIKKHFKQELDVNEISHVLYGWASGRAF